MRRPSWTIPLLFVLSACKSNFDEQPDDVGTDTDTGDAGAGDGGDTENQPPVAVDDSAETRTEETVEIRLVENDTDPDGDILIISEIVQPENGFVQIMSGELRVEYTSVADFVGIDSFSYTVSDQVGGTDQANVTVNVEEVPILTLDITAPTDAEIVEGPDVTVSFEVTGCTVTRPASDPEGCHVHRFVDGDAYEDASGPAIGWYSPSDFTLEGLTAGSHDILLELISNDGSDAPVDPYVSDTVTIEVTLPAG